MYVDDSPNPNIKTKVIVIEKSDRRGATFAQEVIKAARDGNAVSKDCDDDDIFWVVFKEEPHRLWDFTERTLRRELSRPQK